jgi:hypothetical protein
MADLMAIFEFQVPGLWLDQGLVGQRLQMPNGVGWIQFPSDDEHVVRSGHKMLFHTSDLISGYNEVLGEKVTLEINAVVLALPCQLTGTLPASYDERASKLDPNRVQTLLAQARPLASALFTELFDWLRTDFEHDWLLSRAPLVNTRPVAEGLYDDQGERLPYGALTVARAVTVRLRRQALTRDQAERLLMYITMNDRPSLASLFLADADAAVDLNHSVLLAAIGCEAAVKTALREGANTDQLPLVELLLDRPRDFSVAAAALFDEPCRLVLGRSLKTDDSQLFKKVWRLFEDRNKIVHRALDALRPPSDLRDEIAAAAAAVSWLEEMVGQKDGGMGCSDGGAGSKATTPRTTARPWWTRLFSWHRRRPSPEVPSGLRIAPPSEG